MKAARKLIKKILKKKEYIIVGKTKTKEVIKLIRSLQPYSIDKELIRLGNEGDGGYLVPDDLDGIEACFSPGVDIVSDFEKDCSKKGMKIFLADKSVDKPKASNKDFNFIKKFVGCTTHQDFITMDDWVASTHIDKKSDLLLQMDIEGYEYTSLISMSNALKNRFRVIVIEFHGLHNLWHSDFLWHSSFFHFASSVFNKLLENHTCVHIHPNNCCGIIDMQDEDGVAIPQVAEFTFIRNDRIKSKKPAHTFPHPLDSDNTKKIPIVLPKIWYDAHASNKKKYE